jgi:thiol-disulfide isomerase/thioredoxin
MRRIRHQGRLRLLGLPVPSIIVSRQALRIASIAAVLVLPPADTLGDDPPKKSHVDRGVAVERLLVQLRSDLDRGAGEDRQGWYTRICLKNLDVADKILAHADATAEHRKEAIDRKLVALGILARRDPDRYKQRWTDFAHRVIDEHPGSSLARDAAHSLLEDRVSDDPTDPGIASAIEHFAKTYPGSGGQTDQLYYRLTGLLYKRDRNRALGILDRAISTLPPDQAVGLRKHKNALTMIGSKLTMSWPRLDGKPLAIEDLRGKVVLVYSWATWCGPCIEKFPMLNDLYAKHHFRGFEIVAVSQDKEPPAVVEFLKSHDLPWIHVMHSEKFDEKYGYQGTPGSLLINREGIVVGRGMFGREGIESAENRSLEELDPAKD